MHPNALRGFGSFIVHRNAMTMLFPNFRISVVTRLLLPVLITTVKVTDENLKRKGFILSYSLKAHSPSQQGVPGSRIRRQLLTLHPQ